MRNDHRRATAPLLWAGTLFLLTAANSAAQPNLLLGPSSVEFVTGNPETPPAAQKLFLASEGGSLSYEAKAGYWSIAGDWLSVTPSTGTTPATLSLSVDAAKLPHGVYFGYVEIKSGAANAAILTVTLRVGDSAPDGPLAHTRGSEFLASDTHLRAEPNELNFRLPAGSNQSFVHAFAVGSRGSVVNFTASSGSGSWLAVGPQSGNTDGSNLVSVAINPANMPAGTHTGSVTVVAPGTAEALTIPVTVELVAQAATGLATDKSSVSLTGPLSGPAQTATISVSSSAGTEAYSAAVINSSDISCNVSGFACFLTVTPSGGTTPSSVTVRADPSLVSAGAGTYTGTIDLHGGLLGEELRIPVTYTVTSGGSSGSSITATPSAVSFTQAQGGTAPSSKTVQLSSTTAASFTAVSTASWLTVTPASGTTPATLTLTANAGSMTVGTYTGKVNITSGSTTTSVDVTLAVTAPTTGVVTATPSSATFTYTTGGTTPSNQTVQLSSTTATSFTAASSASWLTVTPASGTTPANLTLAVNPAGLSAGQYQANVTITAGGTTTTVPVTLTVSNGSSASPITATPSSLTFTQVLGGSAPTAQTVQLSSTNATAFTVTTSANWLTVTPTSGTTPTNLTVNVNASGMTAGTYQGAITVTAGSTTTTVNVTLTVTSSTGNSVTSTPSSLTFSQTLGGSTPSTQTVQLSSTTAASFTAVPTVSWLTVNPASGTTPATLTIGANASSLVAGTYQGAITITAGSNTASIPVSFTVNAGTASGLTATPSSLNFSQAVSGAAPAAQTVQLSSTTAANFSAVSTASWLSVNPTSGTTPATLTITANGAGLAAATYQGSITVTTGTTSTSIPVTLTLAGGASSTIVATPTAVAFSQVAGQNAFSLQNIQLSAATPTSFSASSDQTWLTVSPNSGTAPATLTISASPGMAAGTYQGTITITGGSSTLSIPVVLTVSLASNAITASPSTISFTQVSGGTVPAAQTLQLSSPSPTGFTTSVTSTWLTVTPASGTTPAGLSLTVNPAGLTTGTYQDTITINGGATPVTVPVTLTISNDAFAAAPSSLSFTQSPGGTVPPSQTVQLTSGVPRNFTAISSVPWLSVSPGTGMTPATLTVSANGASLSPGTYTGTITVNGAGTPLTIPVTLTVSVATGAVFNPASLSFTSSVGGQTPSAQTVSVISAGSPFAFTATATAGNSGTWLTVTPTSGNTPASLTVTANPSGLAAGKYSGIVTVTPTDSSIPPQTLPVTLTVGSSNSTAFVRSILNAASFLPGPVAPGEIITITGTGLGPVTGATFSVLSSGAIDTQLGGTRVLFDGIPAPLLWVRADQINAIVPYNVYGRTGTNIVLQVAGVSSDPIGLRVENTSPAVFTVDGSGHGQGAVVNQDGTVNSPTFAAPRGSVIAIFGTGEGQTNPAGQDGRVITTDVRAPIAPISVRVGGQAVPVYYVGSAPGEVSGLFQVNVFLPANLPTGPQVPLELTMGSFTTQFGLTIAIK